MHHSDEVNPPELQRIFSDIKRRFGATGRFPEGKLTEHDEGEIAFGVTHDPATGKVVMAFGKPVAWIGMSAAQARALGRSLFAHAADARIINPCNEDKHHGETQ